LNARSQFINALEAQATDAFNELWIGLGFSAPELATHGYKDEELIQRVLLTLARAQVLIVKTFRGLSPSDKKGFRLNEQTIRQFSAGLVIDPIPEALDILFLGTNRKALQRTQEFAQLLREIGVILNELRRRKSRRKVGVLLGQIYQNDSTALRRLLGIVKKQSYSRSFYLKEDPLEDTEPIITHRALERHENLKRTVVEEIQQQMSPERLAALAANENDPEDAGASIQAIWDQFRQSCEEFWLSYRLELLPELVRQDLRDQWLREIKRWHREIHYDSTYETATKQAVKRGLEGAIKDKAERARLIENLQSKRQVERKLVQEWKEAETQTDSFIHSKTEKLRQIAESRWGSKGTCFITAFLQGKSVTEASQKAGISRQIGHKYIREIKKALQR
jgi:hypothetical protein